ncbi:FliC/FljB family flagellin [Salinicola salarius]|uniref:FliC/FljB family flagellin n=1 Tax=Salinicola salarius TaxID=430457 RepID=UPI000B3F84B4|nr:FliC/FljB family flagellin [Salinicola salarius]
MAVINTNITSLIGQQNLNKSQSSLSTAMERLSSGLRINSAADDAAGQAIANRMSSQITGLSQAQRNANDGISVAQTTEGALNQVNDNLQRIRELTVQAQNGTNSQDDLNSIQNEIGQRLTEINRISDETSFNGVDVLAKNEDLKIQVGANDGETIEISLKEINAKTLGLDDFNVNGAVGTVAQSTGDTGTMATQLGLDGSDFGTAAGSSSFADVVGAAETTAAKAIDVEGFTASTAAGSLQMDEAGNFFIEGTDADGVTAYVAAEVTVDVDETTGEVTGLSVTTGDTMVGSRSDSPLASLDKALSDVDSLRSDLGAIQNRFDSAITNLNTTETNLTSARSRIEDADYADEVSNMTRAQILQQAGTSVLAQANQTPQSVLSLLQ